MRHAQRLGRGEPFHIIAIEVLPGYLKGEAVPYEVVSGQRTAQDADVALERPRWTSDDTFELDAGCCGARWHVTYRLGAGAELAPLQDAEATAGE